MHHLVFPDYSNPVVARCAALATQQIALWSEIEAVQLAILAEVVGAKRPLVAAMFQDQRSSYHAATDAMERVMAEARPREAEFLISVWEEAIDPIRERRNCYAHGLWRVSPEVPGAVVLLNQREEIAKNARLWETIGSARSAKDGPTIELTARHWKRANAWAYWPDDIAMHVKHAEQSLGTARLLHLLVLPGLQHGKPRSRLRALLHEAISRSKPLGHHMQPALLARRSRARRSRLP